MSQIRAHGRYTLTAWRGETLLWQTRHDNFVTDAGLAYLAAVALGSAPQRTGWYLGLKGGYQDALPGETLLTKSWPEINPGSGARPAWTPAADPAHPGLIGNAAHGAVIVFTVDADVSGVFLASGPAVGATTDLLFSVADWLTEQELRIGDRVTVVYELNVVAADV